MSNIEKIKAEIERRKKRWMYDDLPIAMGRYYEDRDILAFIDSLPEEKTTCKTCGFYENNCPFIRGKLIPYPNKVCKDYTYSAMKEQEKPSDDLEEAAEKRKMGITPIGIIRMKVQECKWADVDKAGDLDIHPLEKEKYDYAIKQYDKIISFIDNLPLTITKESPVLNEAANDYQTTFNKTIGPFFHDAQKRAFIDGALWQARQLINGTPNRKP